jgi:FLVCR family feline leukemia virus subgroup C receptor-related protein
LLPYGITSDQTSILAASMMVIGIISAAVIGLYVEKTLQYRRVFMVLAVMGITQTIGFSLVLKLEVDFYILLVIIMVQGILFIPMMPLCFDYGCDILFPVGEAQITGTLMTAGQIIGILFVSFCL